MRVLVTGGGKRIGAAIVRAVAAGGHQPIIHYGRSRDAAEALAQEVDGVAVGGDLADAGEAGAIFGRACAAAGGPIDGLVNSASLFEYDHATEVDAGLAARLWSVNTLAPALLAGALARQGREGAVVNLLDQKVANPNPDFFSYSLTKFALDGATAMMAQAFAPRVRVNAVSPGLTLPSGEQTPAGFERTGSANLLRHPVGVEAVAEAVLYLLEARSVTGQNLYVDCGQRFLKRGSDVMFEQADG